MMGQGRNSESISYADQSKVLYLILHVFSCRLYGLRKYKDRIKGEYGDVEELQDGNLSDH